MGNVSAHEKDRNDMGSVNRAARAWVRAFLCYIRRPPFPRTQRLKRLDTILKLDPQALPVWALRIRLLDARLFHMRAV